MKNMVKKYIIVCLFVGSLPHGSVQAQFIKGLINTVKQTAQGRANSKASATTNTVIDKVEHTGSPNTNNSAATTNTSAPAAANAPQAAAPPSGGTVDGGKSNKPGDTDSDSSFLTLAVSADRILSGGGVTISGSSIRYGNMKDVLVTVDGGTPLSAVLPLTDSGHFKTVQIFRDAGDYTITVKSSNRKSSKSITIAVFDLGDMDSIVVKPKEEMQRAYDLVKKWVGEMTQQLAASDAKKLQDKMDDLTHKKEMALQFFDDVGRMGKTMDQIQKLGGSGGSKGSGAGTSDGGGSGNSGGTGHGGGSGNGGISPELSGDFTKMTDDFSREAKTMKTATDAADHKSYDNTICEYIQMLSEACAAFSTITNFFTGEGFFNTELAGIIKSVTMDKGIPGAMGAQADAAGVGDDGKSLYKELGKIGATAVLDLQSLSEKLGKAGFAGDLVQMGTDFFMKKYCGTMSGDFSQDYKCTYTNSSNVVWWEYTYHNEATIKLRYLRSAATPTSIKMKGNIEGNATKFTIYQKPSEMDDFKKAMKNRAQLFSICLYVPPTAPVATSQADKATGFGAVARAVVTPAYFNIPIDVDYNPETGDLKIYCNDAIMDYGPTVEYIYGYICIAAGIPLTNRVNYPIVKARLSIGKVIEKNNDFKMVQGPDHSMSFTKKANFDLNVGSPIAHHISFTVSARSD